MNRYTLVVFVPLTHSDVVRAAIAAAGAGRQGNYDSCSFSSVGYGRYRGNEHSHPAIGNPLESQIVEEERIEVLVVESDIKNVLSALRASHPYEEIAYGIYKLEDFRI